MRKIQKPGARGCLSGLVGILVVALFVTHIISEYQRVTGHGLYIPYELESY